MARVERILLVVAIVALGWYATARASTMLYQAAQHRQLEELRLERADVRLPTAAAPLPPPDVPVEPHDTPVASSAALLPSPVAARPSPDASRPSPDARRPRVAAGLIGRIDIPRLGVSAIVREGIDARTLKRAVGHVPETALPGYAGNVALAGHRDSFFRPLKDVRKGDVIHVRTPDADFTYIVRETRVTGPAEMSVLEPTKEPTLTLITCFPFHFVGDAPDRFIVRAQLVNPATGAGR
jgi:sortase A